ncbi:TonB-dependent receptor, partial [Escherichia coli]|nr:TonB-dependent receptor [Escherichia coli]
MSNTAVYASAIWNTKTGFNLEAGLRFNNHSIYGNNTTFSINPSFKLTDEVTALVNISSGFKTPSLYQLYSEYGNKNLKPE